MTGAGQGAVVPEFSCDENGRFSVEWCRSNTHVLTVTADDDAQMYFSASHGVGLTSSGRWELGEEPPQSFYYAYQAVVGAALSAYDAKCEELATSEREFQAMFKEAVKYKDERDAAVRERDGLRAQVVDFRGFLDRSRLPGKVNTYFMKPSDIDAALAPPTEQPTVAT